MKIKKITLLILLAFFLNSCQGAKDALQGKKRSDSSDEFLIEKKNPLTMPPDIENLPVPVSEEKNQSTKNDNKIKNLLNKDKKDKSKKSSKSNENNSLETTILEQIQD
tara:strand:+ start:208 stop:531 length:324 start_codon:yes stop_codon:yes gene_type:complete